MKALLTRILVLPCRGQRLRFIRPNGFTLVELLVVIAIIAILASLLLPALSGARQQTRMVQCLSNFRQIAVGMFLYLDDNRDRFPSKILTETNNQEFFTGRFVGGQDPNFNGKADPSIWPLIAEFPSAKARPLYPYLGKSEVFACPVDKGLLTAC